MADQTDRLVLVARNYVQAMTLAYHQGLPPHVVLVVTDGEIDARKLRQLASGARWRWISEPMAWGSKIFDELKIAGAREVR